MPSKFPHAPALFAGKGGLGRTTNYTPQGDKVSTREKPGSIERRNRGAEGDNSAPWRKRFDRTRGAAAAPSAASVQRRFRRQRQRKRVLPRARGPAARLAHRGVGEAVERRGPVPAQRFEMVRRAVTLVLRQAVH